MASAEHNSPEAKARVWRESLNSVAGASYGIGALHGLAREFTITS